MLGSNPLACILESNHLTGVNFKDWLRNLMIILIFEKLGHVGAKIRLRQRSWSRGSRGRRRDLQGKSKSEVGLLR